MSATEQVVSDYQKVIDYFKEQGLDLVPLMKEVDDSPPKNAIEVIKREIQAEGRVGELMDLLASEYDSDSDSWWAGHELTIAEAITFGGGEVVDWLSAYANEWEHKEEELFDRLRESEGADRSLQYVLHVLEGMRTDE